MNVLLTHGYFLAEDAAEQKIMRPYPPLGLLYIAAWLERLEIAHTVLDSTFISQNVWFEEVKRRAPKVFAFYVTLMTRKNVLELIAKLRADPKFADASIVLGGPDTRHNAEDYIAHGVDYLVIGEGEETFSELVLLLAETNRNPSLDALSQIEGLAFRAEDDLVTHTSERTKLPNLQNLPLPARHSIDLDPYLLAWETAHGTSSLNISTQRGCPYACRWCSRAVYGTSYRRRDAADVVAEIKLLVERYNPDQFWFVDDVFTINHRWMEAFAEALANENLNIRYECITRAERMNDRILELLAQTGCDRVWIGAESGSQRILDAMKRDVTVEKVTEMMRKTRDWGIRTGTFLMIGYPGETEEDILKTLNYMIEARPDDYTITLAYPIKGTPLFDEVSDFLTKPAFDEGSDRDYKFPRTYDDRYYPHALSYMSHQLALAWHSDLSIRRRVVHRLGAFRSMIRMRAYRMLTTRRGQKFS